MNDHYFVLFIVSLTGTFLGAICGVYCGLLIGARGVLRAIREDSKNE